MKRVVRVHLHGVRDEQKHDPKNGQFTSGGGGGGGGEKRPMGLGNNQKQTKAGSDPTRVGGVQSPGRTPKVSSGGSGGGSGGGSEHSKLEESHAQKARELKEDLTKPARGSHAAAASLHNSAEFYRKKAAESNDPDYEKKAAYYSKLAHAASKKLASGKAAYPTEKSNNVELKGGLNQTQRVVRHLKENRIKMR